MEYKSEPIRFIKIESQYLHKILAILFLFFTSINLLEAQFNLTGEVIDESENPVEFAIVSVHLDSLLIDHVITDSIGTYALSNLKEGNYKCTFQHVSYQDTTITFYLDKDAEINLQYEGGLMLTEAVVTEKKPVLQREIDRVRFNVANTDIVFGSNIWEVIEKTPLVNASEEGNIEISGTNGAIVYINNKRKVLTGAALKSYLSSIPSENLNAIEVITTPPSKYDAEGGAGIINIVMKKNEKEGLIGTLGLSARQTVVNSQAGSMYLNYRKGKWNAYSTVYLSNRNRRTIYQKNIFYPDEYQLTNREINTINEFQILAPGASVGIDHEINAWQTVGVLFDYSGNRHDEERNATSDDFFISTDSMTLTNNIDNHNTQTYSLNLNYQAQLDSLGKMLTIDLDALEYESIDNSVSKTEIISTENEEILSNRNWFRSGSPQQISNQSAKLDFECPINEVLSFETGLKTSFSTIDNDLIFEDRIAENVWEKDPLRSNLFRYKENINSIYAIFNHKLNAKWSYQIGTRVENTIAKGWLEGEEVVDRNYTNVFPTAFLKYAINDNNSLVLALTSRITRPSFWDVNPFRVYTTDQAYFEGNPFLLPSRYYRQELNYTLYSDAGTFTFQTGASQLLDEFYALPYNPDGNVIANRKVNYGNKYAYFETITYNNKFMPWWRFAGTMLAAYIESKGSYADNIIIDNQSFLLSLSANQTFTLSKEKGLSLTVVTNNTFPVTIVNTRIQNRLATEVRLRKTLGDLNITLSARDLFKSNKDRYNIELNEIRIIDENYHDTRSAAIALSYNFGKSTVRDKRYRSAGNRAEQRRLK